MFRSDIRHSLRALITLLICNSPLAGADVPASPDAVPNAYSVLQRHGLLESEAPAAANNPPVVSQTAPPDAVPDAYGVLERHGLLQAETPAAAKSTPVVPQAAPSGTAPDAYGVLQRLGLLQTATPAAAKSAPLVSLPAPSTRPSRKVALPTATTLTETAILPRAYQRLRALGLLKSDPSSRSATPIIADMRPKADRVLVDKSERKLFLIRNGEPFREYRISLGKAPDGPKLQEGDLRTPEGVYTLDWRNPKSGFYKSIHISYPNDNDRLQAQKRGVQPGGMIMIHGEHYIPSLSRIYRLASKKDWTDGCIAINNEEMDELWLTVADGTPIEIRP